MDLSGPIHVKNEGAKDANLQKFDVEVSAHLHGHDHDNFHSKNALEILRETVWILRYNLVGFMVTLALLICPVSAVLLPSLFVDQSVIKNLTIRLILVAKSSGLPLRPFIKQSCQKLAETAVSSTTCFPLFITVSLVSKVAVVYSVDCTYSRRKVHISKFCIIVPRIWRRLVRTYLWVCMIIVACVMSFCVILSLICSSLMVLGFSPDANAYAAVAMGLAFSVVFANAIIICNTAIVICILEDVLGLQALTRARDLVQGQTQVGLLIFLGSTIGMALVEGLFEHRVKTLSYGDGSSRVWEGPLLVVMYSFVVLIDSIMSAVFYFSCRAYSMEFSNGESPPILECDNFR